MDKIVEGISDISIIQKFFLNILIVRYQCPFEKCNFKVVMINYED
ncbi:MAG: hypothetical protein JWO92_482 [Chitinophagaceae bacterium]|nr:hypothetical protein [Chitinophagaceae bacterium]